MKKKKKNLIFSILFLSFFLFYCITQAKNLVPVPDTKNGKVEEENSSVVNENTVSEFREKLDWAEILPGIEYSTFEYEKAEIHCLKTSLSPNKCELDLNFRIPDDKVDLPVNCFLGKSVKELAENKGFIGAVNGTPFYSRNSENCDVLSLFNPLRQCAGILYYSGVLYSPGIPGYDMLVVSNDMDCRIMDQEEEIPSGTFFALGGFWQVLKDGDIQKFNDILNSRTFAGFNDSGEFFLLVAEGEPLSGSRGLSFENSGKLLRSLGCTQGIQLDGGSSSSFVLRTEKGEYERKNFSLFPGGVKVVNCIGIKYTD